MGEEWKGRRRRAERVELFLLVKGGYLFAISQTVRLPAPDPFLSSSFVMERDPRSHPLSRHRGLCVGDSESEQNYPQPGTPTKRCKVAEDSY